MIDAFRAAFQELIDASLLGDPQRFGPAVGKVYGLASRVPSSEREIALEALGPIFSGHHTGPGVEADLTVVAGAFVEMGTAPGATGIEVLRLLREVGKAAGVFLHAWENTGGGPPPEPERVTAADEKRVAATLGDSASTATLCWWTARRYGLSAKTMLSVAGVRSAIRRDPAAHSDLLAIAGQLSAHLPEYGEVSALLRMDEVSGALVLDRASRRGFRVRFEGIGDNFQLHTLLANALIGEQGRGLGGERPDPRWVAAFENSDPDPQARVVHGWWNLVGADGTWVWNEGVPADIPLLEGERILILEEQTYPRSWNAGRLYPLVAGSLRVTEELDRDEAARWWSLIEPEEAPEPRFDASPADPFAPQPPSTPSWWDAPASPAEQFFAEPEPPRPVSEPSGPERRFDAEPFTGTPFAEPERFGGTPFAAPEPSAPVEPSAPEPPRPTPPPEPERFGGNPFTAPEPSASPVFPTEPERPHSASAPPPEPERFGGTPFAAPEPSAPVEPSAPEPPRPTPPPEPEPLAPEPPAAPERRPPSVATAATEVFRALTDADLAAYDERVRAGERPDAAPSAATEVFTAFTDADLDAYAAEKARNEEPSAEPDEEDTRDGGAPGSRLLPPLPPGVSDNSGWGPSWL
ncbi:hypothetical protein [Actinorugispora endophytica]|uniref:Uncharacterized protein n=1 Tax=Actinorugispora endophytica TaxID=1605990 RepID=A0A4R6UG45_9ACTN|nr:hypothetical protein [Actinorugispora endophytica]TDQ44173.1 hypothetical protein EV190_13710 [Actinorugispora endophytica]